MTVLSEEGWKCTSARSATSHVRPKSQSVACLLQEVMLAARITTVGGVPCSRPWPPRFVVTDACVSKDGYLDLPSRGWLRRV